MSISYLKEACVETFEQAIAAEKNGANRIELCANLAQDGITPSKELILKVVTNLSIPVRVMIRPREGDFMYTGKELADMEASIIFCKKIGVEGVVFGILKADKTLDIDAITKFANLAAPLKVVIHKAIDYTPNILYALEQLSLVNGISTILTSGGAKTALEGSSVLKEMIKTAPKTIEIMPAGGITIENLDNLDGLLGASAYHGKRIVGELI